jgi:quercetin dioxygenase-like cupin family protein
MRRSLSLGMAIALLITLGAGTALGNLVAGSLPAVGYTYTSATVNDVNMQGDVKLKTKGTTIVKTTYSRVAPSTGLLGTWHYHNGPVIVTVTAGTLTLYDSECGTWDVSVGESYIESTGQILVAKALPDKNSGIASVEWFTTRLYPEGTTDPVEVPAPCIP